MTRWTDGEVVVLDAAGIVRLKGDRMTDQEYERFFELLGQIINGFGHSKTKADELSKHGDEYDRENLAKLAEWFYEG